MAAGGSGATDRLVLGTAQLGGGYGLVARAETFDTERVEAILRRALELGVTAIDTAPAYGDCEQRIGDWLDADTRRDAVWICTKLPGLPPDLEPAAVERAVAEAIDDSRRRLQRDFLDLYLVHDFADLQRHGAALFHALAQQLADGRIGRVGVSVYTPEEAMAAARHSEVEAIQLPFNVFDRHAASSGALDALRRHGCETFVRSALLQGLLVLDAAKLPAQLAAARPWLARLAAIWRRHQVDPLEGALRYAAFAGDADRIVLGVDSPAQLERAVAALEAPLADAVCREIELELAEVPGSVSDPRTWGRIAE